MKWLILFSFALVQHTVAQETALRFEEANQLYRAGDFQKAATIYEQIRENGYESPALYYNLGNAYFKLHNIPAAILNYERAKRIAPHDEDNSYNLRIAQLQVVDRIEQIPQLFLVQWWQAWIDLYPANNWAVIGITCLWCTAFAAAMFIVARRVTLRRVAFILGSFSIIVCLFSFIALVHRHHIEQTRQSAIVFSPSASVKSAPDSQSTDLFILHEGLKVELVDSVAEWMKIRLADGKIGWLPAGAMQII